MSAARQGLLAAIDSVKTDLKADKATRRKVRGERGGQWGMRGGGVTWRK